MVNASLKKVTVAEIEQLFREQGWGDRLRTCTRIEFYAKPTPIYRGHASGTVTIGYKYKDRDDQVIALVFHYKHPNGSLGDPHPKRLLIEGTWYYV